MLGTSQQSSQRQGLSISQSTIEACRILSMSIDELHSYIQDAATGNPIISFESIPQLTPYGKALAFPDIKASSIDFASNLASDKNLFASSSAFKDLLYLQIPPRSGVGQERILRYLINSLDKDGYYRDSTQDSAHILSCTEADIDEALAIIQHMEPHGVGARDLRECLLLQLERRPTGDELPLIIVRDHFEQMVKNQIMQLSKALCTTPSKIHAALDTIQGLDCRPAGIYSDSTARYIIPDVTIGKHEDDFTIQLNRDNSLGVHVDSSYADSLGCGNDKDAIAWLQEKSRQASMLQLFVQKRNSTLLLVCSQIFEAQKPFFFKGPEYLRPLKQKDIADTLSCHESTVFRAVKGKYLSCSWGTFPLTYFFSNTLECGDGFDPCNAKQMIRRLIDSEDKLAPISDGSIAEKLKELGIQISRRTVAKYRSEASIPNAAMRKKYT